MNNEIGRKITSLTLMTIMLAGGMVIAAPSMMPAAHAADNANLFVSAENSQFDNYMSGPQVIEIVVIDSNINDTDEAKGEPDVTVNGKIMRMVQAVDGNWYGYFADRVMATTADATSVVDGMGLDFGTVCTDAADITTAEGFIGLDLGDANGIALGATDCAGAGADPTIQNVLREAKDINTSVPTAITNPAGVEITAWPFIQLYTLNPTGNVVVTYNKGGDVQTTTLTFDTVDNFASSALDRTSYTPGSEVHATITDLWLNIDPTDEDSWTFGTTGGLPGVDASTNYQVFNENGAAVGDVTENTDTNLLTDALDDLMCEDNCRLVTVADAQDKGVVISLRDNDDSAIVLTVPATGEDDPSNWETEAGFLVGAVPVTITEQGPNSGVFGTYDESDSSNIVIVGDAARGTSAIIDYNETAATILVGLIFGTIDIMPVDDEWSSGEEIPLELFDPDANRNSRADEDLDLNDPLVKLVPSLQTGSPVTLGGLTDAELDGTVTDALGFDVQAFSDRAILTTTVDNDVGDTDTFSLDFGTMEDFFDSTPVDDADFHGFALFNYDVRSLNDNVPDTDSVDITLAGELIATDADLQGLILLDSDVFGALPDGTALDAVFEINGGAAVTVPAGTEMPVVADIFGFGFLNDGLEGGDRLANQIIRIELEESGDNTGLFEGSLEYIMINQLNVLDPSTYEGLSPIADDPNFIVIEDLTDEDSPRVNYLDRGADGVSTQIADQEEAPSHSGIVSFDLDTYKVADTVVITLQDLDLNVDSDLIDIYTTVDDETSSLNDIVGDDEFTLTLSDGDELGRVLDVTFDDTLWTTPAAGTCTDDSGVALEDLLDDTGLAATGFTLIETDSESGEFVGDWQIPTKWCRPGATSVETTTGLDLEVNYVDFRDASGEVIEVGDSAGVRANTGSVSLDRTVYPVPFGVPDNFGTLTGETSPDDRSIFAIHASGINDDLTVPGSFLPDGDLIIHIRINDPDFDISAAGEDVIAVNRSDSPVGPVEISIIRGSDTVVLGTAGGPDASDGPIHVGDGDTLFGDGVIELDELISFETSGADFDDSLPVEITQAGQSATDDPAIADITDLSTGVLNIGELDITIDGADFDDAFVIEATGDTSLATATIAFVDINGDSEVAEDELVEILSQTGTFTTLGETVTLTQTGVSTADASADFIDAVGSLSLLSIDAITDGGTGFSGIAPGETVIISQTGGAFGDATDATAIFLDNPVVNRFGPIDEIAPDAGIFEIDIPIQYTDGPADATCPTTLDFDASTGATDGELTRFNTASPSGENYCILQGDILQIEYVDPTDASGDENSVTDSATFDLRNGVLQSDKSVYIIGSDMILTLIEPDLDLDNDQAETWDLDLIEWDSDAATITMGDADGEGLSFDPEPLNFRETGDSTGIFQIVIEIPEELEGDKLERGEEIILEYTDWGPSGSDFVGDEDEDVNVTLFTSNFGATVELDQKVYTWTDKVYMTIVAPDHNFDGDLIDEIGDTDDDPIKVSTRGFDIDNYKLVETGTDTGIFTGEIILTGFEHDADGQGDIDTNPRTSENGSGPTDGFLETDDDDGLTVSFEFSEDETIVGSSLIRWNIGEVQWLEASYPASGTGVVRVIDPDMNLDPEAVDNFDVDVWSDSDAGGIDLTVTETNEATGIFEGTVFFTVADESSGHRLRVAEGDTVTAEYEDNTLPDPYTTADELDITATSLIGTIVPPLERAPIASCRVVDAFGNSLSTVSVDQQVQITCDLANGQDREQQFAYLIQVQDGNGVTVSLAWITGSLAPGQSFSPALSWIPEAAGAYDATAFVWESIDNPTALSPPTETAITVN